MDKQTSDTVPVTADPPGASARNGATLGGTPSTHPIPALIGAPAPRVPGLGAAGQAGDLPAVRP